MTTDKPPTVEMSGNRPTVKSGKAFRDWWTHRRIIEALREAYAVKGKPLTFDDCAKRVGEMSELGLPSYEIIRKQFNGFPKALEAAELPTLHVGNITRRKKRRKPSKQAVKKAKKSDNRNAFRDTIVALDLVIDSANGNDHLKSVSEAAAEMKQGIMLKVAEDALGL